MKGSVLRTVVLILALFAPLIGFAPVASAAAPQAVLQARYNGMVDVWVFIDADQNGYYSAGDTGLSDALACVRQGSWTSCVGTDEGDTWWEDLKEAGGYSTWVVPGTVGGYRLRSIRCQETGSQMEYPGCHYNLQDWSVKYKLNGGKRINIFYGLAVP